MLEGTKINLGGREFIAPPLPLKVFRVHPEWFAMLAKIDGLPTPESVEVMTKIVLAALNRNYPELTEDDLGDLLDIVNLPKIMQIVMGQTQGEAVSP